MIRVSSIAGNIFHDESLAKKFEEKQKAGKCEFLKFSRTELEKKRIRWQTSKGTDVGLVLDSNHNLHNGDVLLSDTENFIVIEQVPEKVISVKTKETELNSKEILVKLGHLIGNRHRPIQIDKDGKIIFPILSDSELDTFKELFSSIIDHIEMNVEEQIFEPLNGMIVHEH